MTAPLTRPVEPLVADRAVNGNIDYHGHMHRCGWLRLCGLRLHGGANGSRIENIRSLIENIRALIETIRALIENIRSLIENIRSLIENIRSPTENIKLAGQ